MPNTFVLGEDRGIKRRIHDIQVQKPLEQEVVPQPLTELALTAYGIQRDQQTRLEKMLRWNRWPSRISIHPVKEWRKLA